MANKADALDCANRRNGTAFTLIELLVVISIIALLISVLLPALSKARGAAQQMKCSSLIRQYNIAAISYSSENRDFVLRYNWCNPNPATYLSYPENQRFLGWFVCNEWREKVKFRKQDPFSFLYTGRNNSINNGQDICPLATLAQADLVMQTSYGINYDGWLAPDFHDDYGSANASYVPDSRWGGYTSPSVYEGRTILTLRYGQIKRPSHKFYMMDSTIGTPYNSHDPLLNYQTLGERTSSGSPAWRHNRQANIAFLDGHMEIRSSERSCFNRQTISGWNDYQTYWMFARH